MASRGDTNNVWIYHERQEALLCGQHALNNLVQAAEFTSHGLAEVAQQLDQMELNYMAQNDSGGVNSKDYLKRISEGSANVDASGNFSIEVLRSALMNRHSLSLPNIRQEGVRDLEVTDIEGFICNKSSHWFAIRKINGRYWNLNSTAERPALISHFRLAAEIQALQNDGYSVFCVTDKALPPPCTSDVQRSRGLPQYWWKEDDLIKGKTDATTGATDPWRNVGGGMRLDGRAKEGGRPPAVAVGTNNDAIAIDDDDDEDASLRKALEASRNYMSEEEMIRMAVEASLMDGGGNAATAEPAAEKVKLTPEPEAGGKGVTRIQFRLPNGSRVIRRFLKTDSVNMVYAFVEDKSPGVGRMELKAGFPPKDISGNKGKTIEEANLSGETIHGRYV
mmetsp:Transcript_14606/g.18387  ORF Transcript_14606/g.18387 Transcript_14606/m.18387 type:complete len:392 (+) Transcript_14606:146-1321(+)|eukprot:CAMPEP_0172497116 /NCGR_PEP_ID=MMETSP1066-20121228/95511_1 /TAXON_ID=671091 /ORGANISM="Coscinodiscus wailesii, Strain CCMP2513" /LENGTH=391 /DNA_ID=CAMNT_0013269719 /DNA_START=144 /DNA_END=1319 /DNA_ORIENTATION=-